MKKTLVSFLWHMHQPDYRLPGEPLSLLPWVRLHATKAYYDMPWLLERHPNARACINLSGSLLSQMRAYLSGHQSDTWAELTRRPPSELGEDERRFVLEHFFSVHWDRQIKPLPGYWRLLKKRGMKVEEIRQERFSDNELRDLQVFFNLAWMGFAARRDFPLVEHLREKGGAYSEDDKAALLDLQLEIMGRVLPMLRALSERGQVELTTTPMCHPILPLLIDTDAARRSAPDRPVPPRFSWPQDATWHVEAARDQFEALFGAPPAGMWPAEGSVSPEVVPIFSRAGVRWIASDEDVLMASHPRPHNREDALYRPYRLQSGDNSVAIVFRDHLLSDLIGFTYASQDAEQAASDMIQRLREGGQRATSTGQPLINVILDGENPWESYPEDGLHFLTALYDQLDAADDLESITVSQALDRGLTPSPLAHLHSGSWIRGNYQIWIGARETNAAWKLLGEARRHVAEVRQERQLDDDDPALLKAMEAIHTAEGSDWFWWYGDDFSSVQDAVFDDLFRGALRIAYQALGDAPPGELRRPISTVQPSLEIVAPTSFICPAIDGRVANFYEWSGAGRYEPRGGAGSMYRARRTLKVIYFGFDLERFYLRLDPDIDFQGEDPQLLSIRVLFQRADADEPFAEVHTALATPDRGVLRRLDHPQAPPQPLDSVAYERLFELAVPFSKLDLQPNDAIGFAVVLERRQIEIDRHPPQRQVTLTIPDETFEQRHWLV